MHIPKKYRSLLDENPILNITNCIYAVVNLVNRKYYIGRSERPLLFRWFEHQSASGECPYLDNAIKFYGKENFTIYIITCCNDLKKLKDLEIFWIALLNARDHEIGYNIAVGGQGFQAGVLHPFAGKVGPNKGKKFPKELYPAYSNKVGIPCSLEKKQKLREAAQPQAERQRGKPNEPARIYMLQNNPMKRPEVVAKVKGRPSKSKGKPGRKWTPEQRLAKSIAMKNRNIVCPTAA